VELPEQVHPYCAHHGDDLIRDYEHDGNMCVWVVRLDEMTEAWAAIPKALLPHLTIAEGLLDDRVRAGYLDVLERVKTDTEFVDLIKNAAHETASEPGEHARHDSDDVDTFLDQMMDQLAEEGPYDSREDVALWLLAYLIRLLGPAWVPAMARLWSDGYRTGEKRAEGAAVLSGALGPLKEALERQFADQGLRVEHIQVKKDEPISEEPDDS
jgi:hypothetical protein